MLLPPPPISFFPSIFFLLLFPPSSSLVYRLPIRSTGSIRTRLLHSGEWRAVVDQTRNDLSVDSDRHLEFYRGFYTSVVKLGTPRNTKEEIHNPIQKPKEISKFSPTIAARL